MRKAIVALTMSAFALGAIAPIESAFAAQPKMSKMGCVVGKQKWDAGVGKCVEAKLVKKAAKPAKPAKPAKKLVKKPVKPAEKKAA